MWRSSVCVVSWASAVPISAPATTSPGIVDAGVHARVGDERGESAQRDRRRREHVADAGREGEGGSGVAGGERGRGRHPHVTGDRYLLGRAVGAAAAAERLQAEVDDGSTSRRPRRGPSWRRAAPGGLRSRPARRPRPATGGSSRRRARAAPSRGRARASASARSPRRGRRRPARRPPASGRVRTAAPRVVWGAVHGRVIL